MAIIDLLLSKKITAKINKAIELFTPPILSDRKLVACFFNLLQGRGFRYIDVTKDPAAYPRGIRDSDCSNRQWKSVMDLIVGHDVLDIGCGNGSFVRQVAAKGFLVTGVDPNGAPGEGENWRVFKGFAGDFDFPCGSFDTVISLKTLEHIPDARTALASWKRLARKRVILVLPCQRYRKFVYDGHINFYPDEYQLRMQLGLSLKSVVEKIDGEWLVYEDLSNL